MADYDTRARTLGTATRAGAIDEGLRAYMLRVYNYMLMGLTLTGATAFLIVNTPLLGLFFNVDPATGATAPNILTWIALFAPLGMVMFLSFRIQTMSFAAAQTTFWIFSSVMGISLAPVLLIYTGTSIAQVFFITAATFGTMSLWGYTTKRDLTGWGSFLFMGLVGIIIASIVNLFLGSTMMDFVISVIGVIIFTGLTAYDTQKIKEGYSVNLGNEMAGKTAIMGALRLYLDFINLFLMLLRLLGDRR